MYSQLGGEQMANYEKSTNKELYQLLIQTTNTLIDRKADIIIKLEFDEDTSSVIYASQKNELNMLYKVRQQFMLFGR